MEKHDFWICEECDAQNSEFDSDCQFCDAHECYLNREDAAKTVPGTKPLCSACGKEMPGYWEP